MREHELKQPGFGGVRDRAKGYEAADSVSTHASLAIKENRSAVVPASPLIQLDYLPARRAGSTDEVGSLPTELLATAVDRSSLATIVLDANRIVRLKNVSAATILNKREPILIDSTGRLRVANPDIERSFNQFLDHVSDRAEARRSGSSARFLLSRFHGSPVSVSASGWQSDDAQGSHRSSWTILYLHGPTILQLPSPAELRAWFGLTQAEARLACAVASGKTIQNFCSDQGVSLNTVKTQFQSILDKTRVHRQVDLVRLLNSL